MGLGRVGLGRLGLGGVALAILVAAYFVRNGSTAVPHPLAR